MKLLTLVHSDSMDWNRNQATREEESDEEVDVVGIAVATNEDDQVNDPLASVGTDYDNALL